jgi:hypothetical protein
MKTIASTLHGNSYIGGDSWCWNSTFTEEEINTIQQWSLSGWVALANNVQRLANGIEQEGLGRFIYENIESKTTTAQLSSHIGALFYIAEI